MATHSIIVGDLNRRDQLWGGNDVAPERQGEADQLIELMNEHSLRSLLPRGTKTWQRGQSETTIDLSLVSADLADSLIKCTIHDNDHGSDHQAIETSLDVATARPTTEQRLLFKNAPWKEIRTRIEDNLRTAPTGDSVQQQADVLMDAVSETVHKLTPRAKTSHGYDT